MIPLEIEAQHILEAARRIDAEGVPSMRASRHYDVVVNGKKYPPKYLLSVASWLAKVPELKPGGFITTEARHAFGRLGFKIIEKGARKSPTRMPITVTTPSFVVRWADVTCRDVIPLSWLQAGRPLIGVEHEMRDTLARLEGRAKCDVTVTDGMAVFDYRPYRKFNHDQHADLGDVHVAFTAGASLHVDSVEWQSAESLPKVVRGVVEEPILRKRDPKPYIRPSHTTEKTAAFKRERPGQSKFRNELKGIYGGR